MRFLLLDYGEAFFGGAAGGGKSDALLAGAAFGPFLSILGVKPVHSPTVICVNEQRREILRFNLDTWNWDRKTFGPFGLQIS